MFVARCSMYHDKLKGLNITKENKNCIVNSRFDNIYYILQFDIIIVFIILLEL
jgi:hypothetical protein